MKPLEKGQLEFIAYSTYGRKLLDALYEWYKYNDELYCADHCIESKLNDEMKYVNGALVITASPGDDVFKIIEVITETYNEHDKSQSKSRVAANEERVAYAKKLLAQHKSGVKLLKEETVALIEKNIADWERRKIEKRPLTDEEKAKLTMCRRRLAKATTDEEIAEVVKLYTEIRRAQKASALNETETSLSENPGS